jgi:hypothetical protein
MRSTKSIGLFAACGFILSFVAGLFSHSSILSVLIKALIFAVIFGLLGLGISFIFNKFLSDGSNGDFQSEYTADSSPAPAASAVGNNVDITIQDEELRPSESENHFVVGDNHQMLNDSDVKSSANGSKQENSSSQGFVPLRNFETVKNFSGKEAVIPAEAVASGNTTEVVNSTPAAAATTTVSNFDAGGSDGGIDTLPDMENFVFSEGSDSGSGDDDSDTTTESEVVSSVSSKKNDGPAEVQDAALMAKAISSVLSDENS